MAEGLCIRPLLQHGIPGPEALDSLMKEIDDQLLQNQQQLEECVKGLMDMSNDLAPNGEKKNHPGEAAQQIAEYRLLDPETCNDPEPEDVTRFLKHVVAVIEKNPGCEESVLKQLFQLSSHEGLMLPTLASSSDPRSQSVLSINMATDESGHTNEVLWNDVCRRLRKYFIEQLQKLTSEEQQLMVKGAAGKKRLQCIESLCSLYPTQDIWTRYKSLRGTQIDRCLSHNYLKGKAKQETKFAQASMKFQYIAKHLIIMINEDFELLNSGIFKSAIATFYALDELYLERLITHIGTVVNILQDDICSAHPKDNKRAKDDKEMHKSSSEFGILGHIRGNLRRQQSKSLDSLIGFGEEVQFTDLYALPGDHLDPLTHFFSCIMSIELHMDNLYNAVTWEISPQTSKKTKAKKGLKGLLKSNPSPLSSQVVDTKKGAAFSPRSFEKSGLLPEAIPPPFGATQAMMADTATLQRFQEKSTEEKPRWDWRCKFRTLIPDIAKALEIHIKETAESAMAEDHNYLGKNGIFEIINLPADIVGGRLDYPKAISMGVHTLMNEMDRLLPIARSGTEGSMAVIRSAFIDATVVNLKDWSAKRLKIVQEAPTQVSMTCLYVILSSAAYIRNHLLHYEQALGLEDLLSARKSFTALYRQFCELVDAISRQISEYHSNTMSTTILQDAESHYWDDSKDFYENERCSFSIQMWNYHMRSLQGDLWNVCPPKLSQTIYATVLQASLHTLCQRYTRVKPSYRRTTQFKNDITTILLCTSELLFSACNSISKYMDPCAANKEYYSIHNSCCSLLAALAVIASPIDILYRSYKKGFKKRTGFDMENEKGYMSHWMSWILPNYFPYGKPGYEDLQTTTAIYLQLKLLSSQPERNFSMLLQTFLMKEYTLPIMFLARASKEQQSSPKHGESSKAGDRELDILFYSFLDVLLQCSNFPDAVTRVCLPIVEQTNTWELLNTEVIMGRSEPIPPWIYALETCLLPLLKRIVKCGLKVLTSRQDTTPTIPPLTADMAVLPCGCSHTPPSSKPPSKENDSSVSELSPFTVESESETKPGNKDIIAEAIYTMVVQLVEDMYTLPTSVVMLFRALQDNLSQKDVQAPHDCAGLKLMATFLRDVLLNVDHIESVMGHAITEDLSESCRMLAECVYHVLTATSYGKGSGIPRIAGLFLKANRNWVMEQIDFIADHFGNDVFDLTEVNLLDGATSDFAENFMVAETSTVMNSATGTMSLTKVYNFVMNNFAWVVEQLDIPPLVGPQTSPQKSTLNLKLSTKAAGSVNLHNPLTYFNTIGSHTFDHTAIGEFEHQWGEMLQSDLGVTELGFRYLLFHRHEMQEGAYLEEHEKKPVDSLRRKFSRD